MRWQRGRWWAPTMIPHHWKMLQSHDVLNYGWDVEIKHLLNQLQTKKKKTLRGNWQCLCCSELLNYFTRTHPPWAPKSWYFQNSPWQPSSYCWVFLMKNHHNICKACGFFFLKSLSPAMFASLRAPSCFLLPTSFCNAATNCWSVE